MQIELQLLYTLGCKERRDAHDSSQFALLQEKFADESQRYSPVFPALQYMTMFHYTIYSGSQAHESAIIMTIFAFQ